MSPLSVALTWFFTYRQDTYSHHLQFRHRCGQFVDLGIQSSCSIEIHKFVKTSITRKRGYGRSRNLYDPKFTSMIVRLFFSFAVLWLTIPEQLTRWFGQVFKSQRPKTMIVCLYIEPQDRLMFRSRDVSHSCLYLECEQYID